MTEHGIAELAEKMQRMERELTGLSQIINGSNLGDPRPEDQVAKMESRGLGRNDCEKSLAELSARLESISADMVRLDATDRLRRDGDSLRKDLDAQLSAELTLVERVEAMERTIQGLSYKTANGNLEQDTVVDERVATGDAKKSLPSLVPTSIVTANTSLDLKAKEKERLPEFPHRGPETPSERTRRRSFGDVKEENVGPLRERHRSKSIGNLSDVNSNAISGEDGAETSQIGSQLQPPSPPRKASLTNVAAEQKSKKKLLSRRRSVSNRIPRLAAVDSALGSGTVQRSGEESSFDRNGSTAGSKKSRIDVDQMPKEERPPRRPHFGSTSSSSSASVSSAPSLAHSPPERRLSKEETFVARRSSGKASSSEGHEEVLADASKGRGNGGGEEHLASQKRNFPTRIPKVKGHSESTTPASRAVPCNNEEEVCTGEKSAEANQVSIGFGIGDWDSLSNIVDPTAPIDKTAKVTGTEPLANGGREGRPEKKQWLERQRRRANEECKRPPPPPPLRRHGRVASKENTDSSSSSFAGASTVPKQASSSDPEPPPTSSEMAADGPDQHSEGQRQQQPLQQQPGVVRVAVEAVARTVLGAAVAAAGVRPPKSRAGASAGSSNAPPPSPPPEPSIDSASDIPTGTGVGPGNADRPPLRKKSSKCKLAEESKMSTSGDDANSSSCNGSSDSGEWKVTISSKEDVNVRRTSGPTVIVTPKRPTGNSETAAAAVKPRSKRKGSFKSEKVTSRQHRSDDPTPKPGQYPAARPPRDHKPSVKSKESPKIKAMPETTTSNHQVSEENAV